MVSELGQWITKLCLTPPSEMLPHPQHNNQLSTSSNRIEWCINTKSTEKKHKEQLSPWVGTHDINKSTQNQHQLPNKKGIDPSHHGLKRKASPKLKGEWKSWGITKSCINLKLTKYIHWTHRKSARSKRHFLASQPKRMVHTYSTYVMASRVWKGGSHGTYVEYVDTRAKRMCGWEGS